MLILILALYAAALWLCYRGATVRPELLGWGVVGLIVASIILGGYFDHQVLP